MRFAALSGKRLEGLRPFQPYSFPNLGTFALSAPINIQMLGNPCVPEMLLPPIICLFTEVRFAQPRLGVENVDLRYEGNVA